MLDGATLIDGTGREPVERARVGIVDGRIAELSGRSPRAGEDLDLTGLWLLPGLIDLHTHMGIIDVVETVAGDAMSTALHAAHLFRNAELCLLSGHTTAREVGGADGGLRQAIDAGLIPGPRLLPSGPILCQSGGHVDYGSPWSRLLDHHHGPLVSGTPGLSTLANLVDGPTEVRIAARRAFQRGATQIKMCISGGIVSLTDRLEDTQFSIEELTAAVEEARARGTYVTGHAHNAESIRRGLKAGFDCFEHGSFLDEGTAAEMARAKVSLVPTLTVVHLMHDRWREWGVPEEVLPRLAGIQDAMVTSLRLAHAAGVRIGSGTDLLGPGQVARGLEISLKARALGAMEAIVSATRRNAEIIGMADRIGTVEVGKVADLVAVDFDPLASPECFADDSRVVVVVKDGLVVKDTR
ncbi:amidohydrolase family protein [Streptosporangium sp. NPDC004631]